MTDAQNQLAAWTPRPMPGEAVLRGRFVTVEPYQPAHAPALYAATAGPGNDDIWTYMPNGPYTDLASFAAEMAQCQGPKGWRVMVILSADRVRTLGMASYMRIRRDHGSCEIGMVSHGQEMRRKPEATEAHCLLARHVFEDLGYRRYEWKCNDRNAASMAAAERYGFTYEGTFRQDMVVKGENRNTAWYSMLGREWPQLKARYEAWLDPLNFDGAGQQRARLSQL